jgi:hypothetical protein
VGVGGVLTESSGLPDAFGQIFCEVSDVATGLFGAPQNSLDVHLSTELDNVCGFDQFRTSLVPARQRRPSVEISKGFSRGCPTLAVVLRHRGAGHGLATTLGGKSRR